MSTVATLVKNIIVKEQILFCSVNGVWLHETSQIYGMPTLKFHTSDAVLLLAKQLLESKD